MLSTTLSPLLPHRALSAGLSQGGSAWSRSPSPPVRVLNPGPVVCAERLGSTGSLAEPLVAAPVARAPVLIAMPTATSSGAPGSYLVRKPPAAAQGAASAALEPQPSRGSLGRSSLQDSRRDISPADRRGAAPAPEPAAEEQPDRRPSDPFFYPTTMKPLTGLGLSLIEQTTPPKNPLLEGSGGLGGGALWDATSLREAAPAPLFVPAPLGAFVDQPDEMRALEQQNNSLARHIQELEHAKSLAAAQSARALQNIRARQDQLKREAAQAVKRAKEMQEELFPPPSTAPRGLPPPLAREEATGAFREERLLLGSGASTPQPPRPVPEPARTSTPVAGAVASAALAAERSAGASLVATAAPSAGGAASEAPPAAGVSLRAAPLPPTARGLDAPDGGALDNSLRQRAGGRPKGVLEQSGPFPMLPNLDGLQKDNSAGQAPTRRLLGESAGGFGSAGLPTSTATPRAPLDNSWAGSLPASDVPPADISAVASRILTAHQAPGRGGAVSLLPDGQPYVDALGNPLGPIGGPELPNIKDDPVPAAPLAELRACSDMLSVSAEGGISTAGAGTHSMIGSFQPESADANSQPELMMQQAPALARGAYVSHERGPSANVYEAMHPAPRQSYIHTGPIAPQQEQHASYGLDASSGAGARGGSTASGGTPGGISGTWATPIAMVAGPGTPGLEACAAGDAAEAPADAAATPPSRAAPPAADSQRPPTRPSSKEPAPKRGVRRRPDEAPAPAQAGRRPRPAQSEQSEQLQAELAECLDTIKWCAASVTRESLQDLRSVSKPAPVVKEVLEAVALILGQPESRWDKLKKMLEKLPERIQKLNFKEGVNRETFRKLREHLGHAEFDEELIKTVSVPTVPLAMWCRAIGVYLSRTKFKGGPDIRPLAAAGAASQPAQQQQQQPPAAAADAGAAPMVFEPDLATLSPQELRHVRDLTVSRAGVGRITFPGETDCTSLDFEKIVRLEVGEVLVYPESGIKPQIGEGLNRPAVVTMYQCYPPNGSKLLNDSKAQERYRRKIQQMTEEKEATFIDYDCLTGVWKFSVQHF